MVKQPESKACQKYTTPKTYKRRRHILLCFPLSSSPPTCGDPGRNVVPGAGYHLTTSPGSEVAWLQYATAPQELQCNATLAEGGERSPPIIHLLPLTKACVNQTRNFFDTLDCSFLQKFNTLLNVFHFVADDRVQSDLGVSEAYSLIHTENGLLTFTRTFARQAPSI